MFNQNTQKTYKSNLPLPKDYKNLVSLQDFLIKKRPIQT
jgi:hypothetical protein